MQPDDAPRARLSPPLSKTEHRRIIRRLRTDDGMAQFLDKHVGRGKWRYHPESDTWIWRDDRLLEQHEKGRCFVVMRRGGYWHTHVLPPDEALS
jgi:hypothetical protein